MTTLMDKLAASVLPGKVVDVRVGIFRTAIVMETRAGIRCGLAATNVQRDLVHCKEEAIESAGFLLGKTSEELVQLAFSTRLTEVTVGLAAINALLPPLKDTRQVVDENAEALIMRSSIEKSVAVVGHFPFVDRLARVARQSWCLELEPSEGDLPASLAPEILPQADILVITATTLLNHTLQGLMELRKPGAQVFLLGPSTPLSPVLFDEGISVLSGIFVDAPKKVSIGISQGANLRQLFQQGWIRYVNVRKELWNELE